MQWCDIYQCHCKFSEDDQYKNGCEFDGANDCENELLEPTYKNYKECKNYQLDDYLQKEYDESFNTDEIAK